MLDRKKVCLLGIVIAVCTLVSATTVSAQDPKPEAKVEAKKAPAKPRGRLPAYYNQVVTPQQREQIYALQKPILEKIDALEAQIAELKAQLEKESRAVLTADQIKKVEELTAATQEKIKAARAADSKPAQPAEKPADSPAPAKPANK